MIARAQAHKRTVTCDRFPERLVVALLLPLAEERIGLGVEVAEPVRVRGRDAGGRGGEMARGLGIAQAGERDLPALRQRRRRLQPLRLGRRILGREQRAEALVRPLQIALIEGGAGGILEPCDRRRVTGGRHRLAQGAFVTLRNLRQRLRPLLRRYGFLAEDAQERPDRPLADAELALQRANRCLLLRVQRRERQGGRVDRRCDHGRQRLQWGGDGDRRVDRARDRDAAAARGDLRCRGRGSALLGVVAEVGERYPEATGDCGHAAAHPTDDLAGVRVLEPVPDRVPEPGHGRPPLSSLAQAATLARMGHTRKGQSPSRPRIKMPTGDRKAGMGRLTKRLIEAAPAQGLPMIGKLLDHTFCVRHPSSPA